MFRVAVMMLALSAAPAWAERNPCLDYLEQHQAAAELGMSVLVVQVRLMMISKEHGLSEDARTALKEASDDLAKAVAKSSDTMTSIMDESACANSP